MLIYLFRHVPSGRVYVGKHECRNTGAVPRRGDGFLPCCNYSGSSTKGAPWHNLRRKYPFPGEYEYIILLRPQGDAWSAAERRAIRLVRAVFGHVNDDGGRCLNLAAGGDGFTSEEQTQRHADPFWRARYEAGMLARSENSLWRDWQVSRWYDPQYRANYDTAMERLRDDPAYRTVHVAGLTKVWANPDFRERHATATRELWTNADFRERNHDAVLAAITPERNAKVGATVRNLYEDPEYGARITAAVRAGHAKRADRLRTIYRATDKATVGKNERKRAWLLANGPCTGAELLDSGLWTSFGCVSYDLRRGFISSDLGSPEAASA